MNTTALDNRIRDEGEVVGLKRRQLFTPSFLLEAESISGSKFNDLIGNGTRDLTACSIVPHPTTSPRALGVTKHGRKYLGSITSKKTRKETTRKELRSV
jgi:hypothetical protein